MNKQVKSLLSSVVGFYLFLMPIKIFSQSGTEQIVFFSSRVKNPIALELKADTSNISIYARNTSLFPYMVKVKFGEFSNLSPRVFEKEFVVPPGYNRLFTFKIVDRSEPPALTYQTTYYLAPVASGNKPVPPYLLPIGKGKVVQLASSAQGNTTTLFTDQFVLMEGDTIFCSRKGTVTALPGDAGELDRVLKGSLEIRHDDGTIAVYLGLDPSSVMSTLRQTVYPGQPVGLSGSSGSLTFRVYEIKDEGRLSTMVITYPGADGKPISSFNINGTKAIYPEEVITMEMNRKELNSYKKKNLY